ncbi:MAG: FAD:protein FMN transferase [Chloroflexi bacterium]|nr:FAD:protein FMN transferase [Chloroflexota bacterium]
MTQNSARFSRRQFIRMTAVAGLMAATGTALTVSGHGSAEALRVQETQLLMGSIAHLTAISADPDQARAALNAAFERMVALENVFSRYRPESTLSQLNRAGIVENPPVEFRQVLEKAVAYGDLTGGAFDVTVEPLLALYRAAASLGDVPAPEAVAAARELVNYRAIELADDFISLRAAGMAVTLDAIAKGYIIDAGVEVLERFGFQDVMVEVGGDLQARGAQPWRVGIQAPDEPQQSFVQTVEVRNAGLTTSGDYVSWFTPDHRLHHILDPRTGVSPTALSSVSVLASTACDADALSTSLMVLGLERGSALLNELAGVQAWFVMKTGELIHQPADVL